MIKALHIGILGVLILAGGWWYITYSANETPMPALQENTNPPRPAVPTAPSASIGDENLVEFRCDEGKGMTAVFAREIVGLTLSDGRQIELRQVESGSGIQYASNDGSIELAAKGEGGFLQENGATTYANCVALN